MHWSNCSFALSHIYIYISLVFWLIFIGNHSNIWPNKLGYQNHSTDAPSWIFSALIIYNCSPTQLVWSPYITLHGQHIGHHLLCASGFKAVFHKIMWSRVSRNCLIKCQPNCLPLQEMLLCSSWNEITVQTLFGLKIYFGNVYCRISLFNGYNTSHSIRGISQRIFIWISFVK